jgi:cell division protein FtsI/penicillin-binding protein 2
MGRGDEGDAVSGVASTAAYHAKWFAPENQPRSSNPLTYGDIVAAIHSLPRYGMSTSGHWTLDPELTRHLTARRYIRRRNRLRRQYARWLIRNGYEPRFATQKAHAWVNAQSALARSSNVYFYEVTGGFQNQRGIGIEKLKQWWQLFRLDQKTGIDIPGERVGFLPDPDWKERVKNDPWRVGDTYNVAIGQGDFMVTPLGLLNYIASVANGGVLWKPHVATGVLNADGGVITEMRPEVLADFKEKIAGALPTVRRGMRDAVLKDYGTAHLLHDLPVDVAAKTGTAQIQNNQKTNAFFVGYAPYDNPELAIIVLVENSREGGRNTVPIAKDIFMWYYENRLNSR